VAGHRPARQENPRPPADARRQALHPQGPRIEDRSTPRLTSAYPRSLEVEDRRRGTTLHTVVPYPRRTARPWEPCPVHPPRHDSQGAGRSVGGLRVAQDDPVPVHAPHVRIAVGDEWWESGGARENHGPFVHVHDPALRPPGPGLFWRQSFRHGRGGPFQTGIACAISARRSRPTWAENGQNAA